MTEFALALPIFLLLVLGVIEIGHLLYLYSSVYAGAREAARYGASVSDDPGMPRFADCDGIRNQARKIAFLSNLEDDQIVIEFDNPDYGSLPLLDCSEIADDTGLVGLEQDKYNRINVTILANYRPLIPLFDFPAMPIHTSVGRTIIRNLLFRDYVSQEITVPEVPTEPPPGTCPEITTRTVDDHAYTIEFLIDNPTDEQMVIQTMTVYWLDNNNNTLLSAALFPAGGAGPETIWTGSDDSEYTRIPTEGPWRLIDGTLPDTDPVNTAIRMIEAESTGNSLMVQFQKKPNIGPGMTLEIKFSDECTSVNDEHLS